MKRQMLLLTMVFSFAFGQSPQDKMTFEVASVRPSAPGSAPSIRGLEIEGDRVHVGPMVLINLIALAYGVKNTHVQGPAWLTSPSELVLFDIEAKAPAGSSPSAAQQMLQNLLRERFLLNAEGGSIDADAIVLVAAKGGAKLPPRQTGAESAKTYKGTPLFQLGSVKIGNPADGSQYIEATGIQGVVDYLSARYLPTPFVDQTGLAGEYDIKLEIPAPDRMNLQPGESPLQRSLDALSVGLAKLGLAFERCKTPMKAVFIKSVEKRPTEN
jgi:uncharacterized protein (TIGR03435 family)